MTWKFWQKIPKTSIPLPAGEIIIQGQCPAVVEVPLPVEIPLCKITSQTISVCEKCGACCAFFPVSFLELEEGIVHSLVLEEMSLPMGHLKRIMRGTEKRLPRCIALQGEVGLNVYCSIYADRSSTCRNFSRSWEDNVGNSLCDRARSVFGMQPFSQY